MPRFLHAVGHEHNHNTVPAVKQRKLDVKAKLSSKDSQGPRKEPTTMPDVKSGKLNVKARTPSENFSGPLRRPATIPDLKRRKAMPKSKDLLGPLKQTATYYIPFKRRKEMLLSAPLKKTASFPDVKRRIMDVKARQLSPSVTVSSVARACLRFPN